MRDSIIVSIVGLHDMIPDVVFEIVYIFGTWREQWSDCIHVVGFNGWGASHLVLFECVSYLTVLFQL